VEKPICPLGARYGAGGFERLTEPQHCIEIGSIVIFFHHAEGVIGKRDAVCGAITGFAEQTVLIDQTEIEALVQYRDSLFQSPSLPKPVAKFVRVPGGAKFNRAAADPFIV